MLGAPWDWPLDPAHFNHRRSLPGFQVRTNCLPATLMDITLYHLSTYEHHLVALLLGSQHSGGTTQSVSVVSSELGVHVSQRSVSVSLRLLDTVLVGLLVLVMVGVVLRLSHFLIVSTEFGGIRSGYGQNNYGSWWRDGNILGSSKQTKVHISQ